MARKKTLRVSAINIKTQPHSSDTYVQLLQDAYKEKAARQYYGERFGTIGWLYPLNRDAPTKGLMGQILSFVNIDPNQPWFNVGTGEEAEDDELKGLEPLEKLKPGLRRYNFVFYPETHRLVYESYSHESHSLAPSHAQKLLDNLLNQERLQQRYGSVEVVVEPTHEALEEIWNIHSLRSLEIFISLPNPDDPEDIEQEMIERLEEQDAQSYTQTLKGQKGRRLKPGDRTRKLANVAASNGYVSGKGKDQTGKSIQESTKDHPLREPVQYDPATQGPSDALLDAAQEVVRRITGRRV